MSHYNEVMDYVKDIKSNKIISGIYTKKAIERFAKDLKRQKDEDFLYVFKPELADSVINFAQRLYIPDIERKLELLPWHKFIYYNLYGWVHKLDNTRRRFRQAYVEVSRKNSKTCSLLVPNILYDFVTNKSSEAFFVSADLRQAEKTFKEISQVYKESFEYDRKTNITESSIRNGSRFIQFFSQDTKAVDSYKNSCSLIDEYHAYTSDKIISGFKMGARARRNSLLLMITSAGTDTNCPCYLENEKARKILNGTVTTDETYFTIIYSIDESDNWQDSKNFIKANPSLYKIIDPSILQNDLQDALLSPHRIPDFKAKTLGIWQADNTTSWIPIEKYDTKIRNKVVDIKDFEGMDCYGALDLSSVGDFTVYTKGFKKENLYYFFHRYYVPENTLKERYKKENITIFEWVNKGLVKAIPGNVIDYDYILQDVLEDNTKFSIKEISFDRWNSCSLIKRIEENLPNIILIDFDQSLKKMAGPTKEYEKMILEDRVVDPSPVHKWMMNSVCIRPDVNQNYKPLKISKASTCRIDSVITSIMCTSRIIANENKNNDTGSMSFDDILNLF